MNFATIKSHDVANGPGVRVCLFVSGCRNHCPGCFNPETWDFNYGEPFTEETVTRIVDLLRAEYIQGLTILGGDPFEPENAPEVLRLIKKVRQELPNKDIWIYSGYTLEQLQSCGEDSIDGLLRTIDVLVDGPFVECLKDITLTFRGSSNQRILKKDDNGNFFKFLD